MPMGAKHLCQSKYFSMALVADSFHMMSDVIALIIAFISVR